MGLLHGEDLELQVKIAQLQTIVQINLTTCFGIFTAYLTCIIFLAQFYFSKSIEQEILRNAALFLIVGSSIVAVVSFTIYYSRALLTRKKIENLENPFTWRKIIREKRK